MAAITLDEAKEYLGIDIVDTQITSNINRCIRFADAYLKSAIGTDYDTDDEKAKELSLILIDDAYNNRGVLTSGTNNNTRRLFTDLCEQLRCDLRESGDS